MARTGGQAPSPSGDLRALSRHRGATPDPEHRLGAAGSALRPIDGVFRVVNEESRRPVESPTVPALRDGRTVKLASQSMLVARDGTERAISDSAAPIRNDKGEVSGRLSRDPLRSEIPLPVPVDERLVVEFMS